MQNIPQDKTRYCHVMQITFEFTLPFYACARSALVTMARQSNCPTLHCNNISYIPTRFFGWHPKEIPSRDSSIKTRPSSFTVAVVPLVVHLPTSAAIFLGIEIPIIKTKRLWDRHGKPLLVMKRNLSPLWALEVVVMTTYGATPYDKISIMTTLGFQ